VAESGLSLGFSDFKAETGYFLGYGRTIGSFSATQDTQVEAIVQAGVRRIYYPQGVQGVEPGYEWSWLRPTTQLYLGASGADGAGGLFDDYFTSATFTDWVTQGIVAGTDTLDITAITSGNITLQEWPIATVEATRLTITGFGSGSGATFRITRPVANYDLPDGLSRIVGDLHFAVAEYQPSVKIIAVSEILEMRSGNDFTGYPRFAAVRFKTSDGTIGSRQEILLWPRPDAYKVLSYQYEAYQGLLTDAAPYPLGGMHLAELYVESCLSVAEQRGNDEIGIHTDLYQSLLIDAVSRDRKHSAQNYGQMGKREVTDLREFRRGLVGSTYPLTYGGDTI
jgi:hypothetical protein